MIYGRLQKAEDSDSVKGLYRMPVSRGKIYLQKQTYMFDHDQIERVYFVGFQDPKSLKFVDKIPE